MTKPLLPRRCGSKTTLRVEFASNQQPFWVVVYPLRPDWSIAGWSPRITLVEKFHVIKGRYGNRKDARRKIAR
jgi:hypothetical protein